MPRTDRRHFYPRPDAKAADGLWLYGLHAVRAALATPHRKVKRAVLTTRAAEEIGAKLLGRAGEAVEVDLLERPRDTSTARTTKNGCAGALPAYGIAEIEGGRIRRIVENLLDPERAVWFELALDGERARR